MHSAAGAGPADPRENAATTAKIANTRRMIAMQALWAFYTLSWLPDTPPGSQVLHRKRKGSA
ncbi:hypothetical protein Ari01nite_36820 [Paractinoplanes rishiriensis]|uniref:Uncharacterized protein n=1 Tax=Paractinoplanes rishiriensis TaxID=1050105 RepID=A0A919N179_9ACTN|nr:hypothetical protein Ari01nite_36820 [Actinoplanes rishiriensis]